MFSLENTCDALYQKQDDAMNSGVNNLVYIKEVYQMIL